MTLLRSGFWILALSSIGMTQGFAADAIAHAAKGEACDVICEMQAYLNRDHMVAYVPAAPSPASTIAKPIKTVAKAVKSLPRDAVANRQPAPKPAQTMVARPAPRQTAQLVPTAPARNLPPEVPIAPAPTTRAIPGSAPLVTPQFVPAAGAL